jgi:hypothetical protein
MQYSGWHLNYGGIHVGKYLWWRFSCVGKLHMHHIDNAYHRSCYGESESEVLSSFRVSSNAKLGYNPERIIAGESL